MTETKLGRLVAWIGLVALATVSLMLLIAAAIKTYAFVAFGIAPEIAAQIIVDMALLDLFALAVAVLVILGFRALTRKTEE